MWVQREFIFYLLLFFLVDNNKSIIISFLISSLIFLTFFFLIENTNLFQLNMKKHLHLVARTADRRVIEWYFVCIYRRGECLFFAHQLRRLNYTLKRLPRWERFDLAYIQAHLYSSCVSTSSSRHLRRIMYDFFFCKENDTHNTDDLSDKYMICSKTDKILGYVRVTTVIINNYPRI